MAETVPEMSASEVEKKLGNEFFAKKEYDTAIGHYTKAISLEEDEKATAVYYSNRSACYASKKDWDKALEDALNCVSKDEKFVKGYLRLAAAQTELKQYDDAERTLKAALIMEPQNILVGKQLRLLRDKKAGVVAQKPRKQLDEQQRKELQDLNEQTGSYTRDLRAVNARLGSLQVRF